MKLAQPCDDLVKDCIYTVHNCKPIIKQVLTNAGWCCQIDVVHDLGIDFDHNLRIDEGT